MNYESIRQLLRAASPTRIFVGLSGGADSIAALVAVQNAAAGMPSAIALEAVHFDHGLRGEEGRRDADFCRDFCRDRHISCRVVPLDVMKHMQDGEGVEAAARRRRLSYWCHLAGRCPGCVVVLGHHKGDLLENLLLRLLRGSNSSGLTGLRPVTRIGRIVILRPLLSMERGAIESYLRSCGIDAWRHDRSNDDNRFRRNYLRNSLLPQLERCIPGAHAGLYRALVALQDDALLLEQLTSEAASRDDGSAAFWRSLPRALQMRLLRRKIGTVIPGHALLDSFNRILSMDDSSETRKLHVGSRCVIRFRRGRITFDANPTVRPRLWDWRNAADSLFGIEIVNQMPSRKNIRRDEAYFDAERLPHVLRIAPPVPGERMVPFGRATSVKLKVLRAQCGLAAWEAPPLLHASDGIVVWAPLVRHSCFAPVTPETRQIARFFLKQNRRRGDD